MAMLIETADRSAGRFATEEDLGPLAWFVSMLAAFALLAAAVTRDWLVARL